MLRKLKAFCIGFCFFLLTGVVFTTGIFLADFSLHQIKWYDWMVLAVDLVLILYFSYLIGESILRKPWKG
jgi:hypothetical protein